MSTRPIRRETLRARLEAGEPLTLVETLAATSYARGHLPGAIDLPPGEARRLAPALFPDRDAEIVLYCASYDCDASSRVAAVLTALGYTNLVEYHGGKADWIAAGLPIEKPEAEAG